MNWHGYFGDAGGSDWFSGQNQINPNLELGGMQQLNALAAQYNNQYNQAAQMQVGHFTRWPESSDSPAKECEGCGAPGVRYTHHCEYCKRPR